MTRRLNDTGSEAHLLQFSEPRYCPWLAWLTSMAVCTGFARPEMTFGLSKFT